MTHIKCCSRSLFCCVDWCAFIKKDAQSNGVNFLIGDTNVDIGDPEQPVSKLENLVIPKSRYVCIKGLDDTTHIFRETAV